MSKLAFNKIIPTFIISLFIYSPLFSLSKQQKNKLKVYNKVLIAISEKTSKSYAEKLILNPKVRINKKLILLNIDQPNSKKYMRDSLNKKALYKGIKFLKKYKHKFNETEKNYSIDKEVILAILYIETNFNLRKAKYNVFNAYLSLTFADHPQYLKQNLKIISRKYRHLSKKKLKIKKEKLIKDSKRRAKWALNELKMLIEVAKKLKRPVLSIKGSFAGAMGYPQFIPSSYMNYAVDGNGDKFIDLFNIYDAIESVANYLRSVGYKSKNLKSKKTALYHYNHNIDYVNFVLEYAKRIKKITKKTN
jgi:membrane-bound lytic murein transglycosylase B